MIESIEIEWFKKHKHLCLEFDSGVNVITGTSEQGKSTILKAIVWALTNRPRGNGFFSWEKPVGENTYVGISFNNGWIAREKGNKVNQYETSDTIPLKALEANVPKNVTDITNMNAINIQHQHEPYFMITESSGNVARMLNTVIGLDIIDDSLKRVNSRVSSAKHTRIAIGDDILKLQTNLQTYNKLDDFEDAVLELEKVVEKKEKLDSDIYAVERLVEECNESGLLLKETTEFIDEISKDLNAILPLIEKQKQFASIDSLRLVIETIKETEGVIKTHNYLLESVDVVKELTELVEDAQSHDHNITHIQTCLTQIKSLRSKSEESERHVHELQQAVFNKFNEAGRCPLCESEISNAD